MGKIRAHKTVTEFSRLTQPSCVKLYGELLKDYNAMIKLDTMICTKCGEWLDTSVDFYRDIRYATQRYPICKHCISMMVEQRRREDDIPQESKESVRRMLMMMDRVYDEEFYEHCVNNVKSGNPKARKPSSAFVMYFTAINSLPQYAGKSYKDSKFIPEDGPRDDSEIKIIQKTLKNGRKRFGVAYSDEELVYLENEYQDWVTRYECNTKAQEEVFENLSVIKLLKRRALSRGESTKDLDVQQQNWLDTGALKPKQNSIDTTSDAQTFGTLIQKWEETRPIPECDPELADVDKIGLYVDVFFKGHTAKMMGIKNTFSTIYENFMKKFTVTPNTYEDDEDSEAIFEKVFGSSVD